MNTKTIRTGLWICLAAFVSIAVNARSFAYSVDDCIACHKDTTLTKTLEDGTVRSLHVDLKAYQRSVHGEAEFTCVDCHEDATPDEHPATGLTRVECQNCHDDIAENHAASFHGKLLADGNPDAPQCYDCHTTHAVMTADNPLSSVHTDNLRATCGACHADQAAPVVCEAAVDYARGDATALERISLPSTLALLATRLKGHGKTDFGCSYSTKRCSDCHNDVGEHGGTAKQQPVCSECHDMQRSALLFGKIHKPSIFTGHMLVILLIMYAVCIGGLILYFRKTAAPKKTDESEPPAE